MATRQSRSLWSRAFNHHVQPRTAGGAGGGWAMKTVIRGGCFLSEMLQLLTRHGMTPQQSKNVQWHENGCRVVRVEIGP